MKETNTNGITRRKFLLIALAGGVAAVALPTVAGLLWRRSKDKRVEKDTAVMRNPAFAKIQRSGETVLATTTGDKKRLFYRIDPEAEFIWDHVPTAEEHCAGRQVTTEKLLELAGSKYADRNAAQVRKEVTAFLREALTCGVLLNSAARTYVAYKPAK